MSEEETRDDIIEIINNEEPIRKLPGLDANTKPIMK